MLKSIKTIIRFVLYELQEIIEAIIRDWPGRLGIVIRRGYYRCRLKHVGKGVIIKPGVRLIGSRYISIGDYCTIAHNTMIQAGPPTGLKSECLYMENPDYRWGPGEVVLGRYVYLSANCYILGNGGIYIGDYSCCARDTSILSFSNHYRSFKNPSDRSIYFTHGSGPEHECYLSGPVVLETNTGVASHAVILPCVTIHADSFVGIGAVVHKGQYPANAYISGTPGRVMRSRYEEIAPDGNAH
jgi:acetyltransferase-like isoleucine patch superfamily enzyme